jgi:hypothetical protein
MANIRNGRFTVITDEPFVVFLIGMRINRLHRPDKWWFIATAMPSMLAELKADKSKGFLGATSFFYWRGLGVMQYWRSVEELMAYSRAKEGLHLSAWSRFRRLVGNDGSVGIWHETYSVDPGQYECMNANMPDFGLGAALPRVTVGGAYGTARERLRSSS